MSMHLKLLCRFVVFVSRNLKLFCDLSTDVMSWCVVDWLDVGEIASRIVCYISSASHVVQLLVSEAILTSKDRKYVLLCYWQSRL